MAACSGGALALRGSDAGVRQLERGADAVGQIEISALEDALEQGQGGGAVVAGQIEKTELRGGEQVAGRTLGDDFELALGFLLLIHAEEQVGKLAVQLDVGGIELEGFAEFVDVGIAGGKQLAGGFGGARLATTRGGEKSGVGFFDFDLRFPDAAEIEQNGLAVGKEAPGG